MSQKLIPLPPYHAEWIQLLFHVADMMILTEERYQIYWPLVDGFWSHPQTQKHLHGKFVIHYNVCRVSKTCTFSSAEKQPTENISRKTRVTAFQTHGTCSVKIKIIKLFNTTRPKSFTIQQVTGKTGEKKPNHPIDVL